MFFLQTIHIYPTISRFQNVPQIKRNISFSLLILIFFDNFRCNRNFCFSFQSNDILESVPLLFAQRSVESNSEGKFHLDFSIKLDSRVFHNYFDIKFLLLPSLATLYFNPLEKKGSENPLRVFFNWHPKYFSWYEPNEDNALALKGGGIMIRIFFSHTEKLI